MHCPASVSQRAVRAAALTILSLPILAIAAPPAAADEPQARALNGAAVADTLTRAVDPATMPPPPRPLTPREAALRQIVADGQARVAALLAQGQADPSRLEQVQVEIGRVKAETRLRFLQAIVDFARQGGDERELLEAETALEAALHPPVPAPVPNDRAQTDPTAREVRR